MTKNAEKKVTGKFILDDVFSFERYEFGWILFRKEEVLTRKGFTKHKAHKTYHTYIRDILNRVLDHKAGEADTIYEIVAKLDEVSEKIEEQLARICPELNE